MKKIVFCNISMMDPSSNPKCVYICENSNIPVSENPVHYPINAFLANTIEDGDQVKVVLLAKRDLKRYYKVNTRSYIDELHDLLSERNAKVDYKIIESDFSEEQKTHEDMLLRIVDELEEGAHILADITYGPKDLPLVLFAALNFAEKFFNCEIDNIVYGKADFIDGRPVNTRFCDMGPLYYLNSITNTVHCDSSESAKKMLKSLLSI